MKGISLETYGMREAGHIPVRGSGQGGSEGFTLIELLVVLAIISLMAGLSAGAFLEARRNYGLAASAGEIQSIIRRARNQSISPAMPSRSSNVWGRAVQTPASCQSRSRRQQVVPEPHPSRAAASPRECRCGGRRGCR